MLFNENKNLPYYVNVSVKSGESLAIQLFDGHKKMINGPATLTMLSHSAYPPIAIPTCKIPPGHLMQQIVDEKGVLKHIIIGPSNQSDLVPKNQILTKNGSKLVPFNDTRLNGSFKKKLSQSNNSNDTTSYKSTNYKPTRFNGLTNDALLNNSTGLLNSNSLVYPMCCCCCPQCCGPDCLNVSNTQLNSNTLPVFSNLNELNYGRPSTNYYSTTKSTTNNYSNGITRRSLLNNSSNKNVNRSDKLENKSDSRLDNSKSDNNYRKETANGSNSMNINKNLNISTNKNKSINKQPINNPSINANSYSSIPNYQSKGALLSNKQICKQPYFGHDYNNTNHNSNYGSNYNSTNYNSTHNFFNQKYLYSNSFQSSQSVYQSNSSQSNSGIYQASNTNKPIQQHQKYCTSDTNIKQSSLNKNQRASNHSLISQPPLLNHNGQHVNNTTNNGLLRENKATSNTYNPSKKESDYYSELIRYVNSNHISAFKSHKRIDLDPNTTKSYQSNNQSIESLNSRERISNSPVSSSPISEHYDFSSEESEQTTNYKHTLLNYPSNYVNNTNYANSYSSNSYSSSYSNNFSNGSSASSSLSNSTTNKKSLKIKRSSNNLHIESQMNETNDDECSIDTNDCQNSKIIINNDDKDDGYEDDFELKNCDSKSNEDPLMENEELIDELNQEKIIEEENLDEDKKSNQIEFDDERLQDNLLDCKSNVNHNEFNDQIDQLKQIEQLNYQNDKNIECDKQVQLPKDIKINENLDENSNEINIINRNYIINEPQINETLKDAQKENEKLMNKSNEDNDNRKLKDLELIEQQKFESNQIDQLIKDCADKQIKKKIEPTKIITFALSYTKLTANYVNLKWTVLNNGNNLYAIAKENQFMVEMIYLKSDKLNDKSTDLNESSNKVSRIVFTGLVKHCRVQCLKPLEEYSFRVKLFYNDYQLISNLLTITTPELQNQPINGKKRTNKHNIQFNLQQQQILKQQQIIIEQKEKELLLKQSQLNQQQTSSNLTISLFMIFCAIGSILKENFAYLLIIFFSIFAFFFANFISKDFID